MNAMLSKIGAMMLIAVIHSQVQAQDLSVTNSPPMPEPDIVSAEVRARTIIAIAAETGKGFDAAAHAAASKQTIERLLAELLAKPASETKPAKRKVKALKAVDPSADVPAVKPTTVPVAAMGNSQVEDGFVPPDVDPDPVSPATEATPAATAKPTVAPEDVRASLLGVEAAMKLLRARVEAVLAEQPTSAKVAK